MTNRPMPPPPPPPSGHAAPPPPSPAAGTASRPSPPSAAPAPPPPRPPVGGPPAPATSPPRRSTPSSPAVPPRTGPSQAAGAPDFVDGGSALLHRPYRTDEWAPVRKAWWWHTVGMIWLLPFYSVVALTLWQRPSRQSLGRRALWSMAMTLAALSVIGLPAFARSRVAGTGSTGSTANLSSAASAPVRTARRPGTWRGSPPQAHRWRTAWPAVRRRRRLHHLHRRFPTNGRRSSARRPQAVPASVPLAAPPVRALRQSPAPRRRPIGPRRVSSVAQHAAAVDAARHRIDVATIERRLAALGPDSDDTDVDATRRSLEAQLATRRRMDSRMIRLQRQRRRTAAQICEAAAQAEELSVYAPDVGARPDPLAEAVDGLARDTRSPRRGQPDTLSLDPLLSTPQTAPRKSPLTARPRRAPARQASRAPGTVRGAVSGSRCESGAVLATVTRE